LIETDLRENFTTDVSMDMDMDASCPTDCRSLYVFTIYPRSLVWLRLTTYNKRIYIYTVCLKKTSPTFLAVTRESIVGFS